jgi:beta-lactamase class A
MNFRSALLPILAFCLISAAPRAAAVEGFAAKIQTLEARHGGKLGVAAIDLADRRMVSHRGGERFALCSTFKLLLAAAVAARVDRGEETWEKPVAYATADLLDWSPVTGQAEHVSAGEMTVAELCAAAMQWSDNTAANLLLKEIGGPAEVTRFLRATGDSVSRLDRTEPDLNTNLPDDPRDTTTPAAMLATMEKILAGDALSPASRERVTGWMLGNRTGDKRIRAAMDPVWKTGDKTGTGENGAANDVAFVQLPGRKPLLIAVYYTGAAATPAQRDQVIADAAKAVREALVSGRDR